MYICVCICKLKSVVIELTLTLNLSRETCFFVFIFLLSLCITPLIKAVKTNVFKLSTIFINIYALVINFVTLKIIKKSRLTIQI